MELHTLEEFETATRRGVALVEFNAPWFSHCRVPTAAMRRLETKVGDKAAIAQLNVDENRDIALRLGIQSVPTLILFRGGKEIRRFIGLQEMKTLTQAIDDALKDKKER